MHLSEKQQLVTLIVVFTVAIVGEGLFAYSCLKHRSDLHEELGRLEQQEKDARAKIAQIPELKRKSTELAQIIEEYAEILPTEKEVSTDAFLEDIENFMRNTSLIMITGAPVEKKTYRNSKSQVATAKSNFEQVQYRFQLEGTYLDLLKFLNRVENHTRFLEILELEIEPSGGENGRKDPEKELELAENPRKSIEVVISTYTYSKAKKEPMPAPKK